MPLAPGDRLRCYEVTSLIGRGGMGEVYRARDTQLNRDVALKVLPDMFASDPDRLARFRREAQLLASLNHPNIAGIYGLEESDHTGALVLELVEGLTLAERIAQGPIPVDDALTIARQIADALEAAHERGIVHRDLKPANIKLTGNGTVKVLDFGLAKLLDAEPVAHPSSPGLTNSPTLVTPAMTMAGIILGTAAYMSPEQAKGRPSDKRSDIWAFGCVLFEMLTGQSAFAGDTVTEIMAGVIHQEPKWEVLPRDLPRRVARLLRRCLTKDPARRLRDIGDARLDLDDAGGDESRAVLAPRQLARPRWWWSALAFGGGAAVAAVIAWFMFGRPPAATTPVARWTVLLPDDAAVDLRGPWSSLAISRDGRALVYLARTREGRQLYVRRADDFMPHLIGGATDVWEAFFSPDGQWIGFIEADRLKKVAITGGQPVTIADTPNFNSGVWADDGTIYIGGRAGLAKVSADGRLTQLLRPEPNEGSLGEPDLLPDGSILYTIEPNNVASFDDARIGVLTPTGEKHVVVEGGAFARYSPTGHILYARGGQIMAMPFDATSRAKLGEPVSVVNGGSFDVASGSAYFALSGTGVLAYVPGGPLVKVRKLAWLDRRGTLTPIEAPQRFYAEPTISRDGRQVAFTIRAANDDVWTYDIARGAFTRLTFPHGNSEVPIWSPDGRRIVYALDRQGVRSLVQRSSDGSGNEEPLTPAEYYQTPGSHSPDGKLLAYTQDRPDTGSDILILDRESKAPPSPFLVTPVNERSPQFSPDGHWIAYASDETGQFEVFVAPYPGPGRKWQLSQGGGTAALWRSDGREIIYQSGGRLMAVSVGTGSSLQSGPPRQLLNLPPYVDYVAMSPDGERFLVIYSDGRDRDAREIHVVVNWLQELQQRVPIK